MSRHIALSKGLVDDLQTTMIYLQDFLDSYFSKQRWLEWREDISRSREGEYLNPDPMKTVLGLINAINAINKLLDPKEQEYWQGNATTLIDIGSNSPAASVGNALNDLIIRHKKELKYLSQQSYYTSPSHSKV